MSDRIRGFGVTKSGRKHHALARKWDEEPFGAFYESACGRHCRRVHGNTDFLDLPPIVRCDTCDGVLLAARGALDESEPDNG